MPKQTFDLSNLSWTLRGMYPEAWRLEMSMELGLTIRADVPAVPAKVPGSVQAALRDVGILPDWRIGLNTRKCEWAEHRHWIYETVLPSEWCDKPGRKILRADGLDYQGHIILQGKIVGDFKGSFVPHRFDLTGALQPGNNKLQIVFTDVPQFLGGFTSKITTWKERFNYGWDWTPRLVQIGIWDTLLFDVDEGDKIEDWSAYTTYDLESGTGQVHLRTTLRQHATTKVELALTNDRKEVIHRQELAAGTTIESSTPPVPLSAWNVRGQGDQTLYSLTLRLLDASGQMLDEQTKRVGFRQITWKQCEGAPAGAEPWICCVNGNDTFLRGFNWVPLLPNFADTTEEQYRAMLAAYHDIGTNVLRVWGGAVLEKEFFYNLCDELGILIWQEFPLCSSGFDNWPPEEPEAIGGMDEIVRSYITRRQHHASLLLWCGGNELQGSLDGGKTGAGKPVDVSHPMIAAMAQAVSEIDPTRRFLPTSASGPRFLADEKDFGKGLHHDVHGPWNHSGDLESWKRYWDNDDSLFRSETGMPSASPADLLTEFGQSQAMPASAENLWWNHVSSCWIQWEEYLAQGGSTTSMDEFVQWSQQRQATFLAAAAEATQRRFPRVGGFIGWMGHDCFPCPTNTSVIDCKARPKPAALALRKLWRET